MKRLLCLIFMVLALLLPMTAFAVQPPTVTTNAATSITSSGATLNGTANANFADSAVSFEYVTSSTLAATPATVSGNTPVSFSGALTGLTPGTSYNFWAVATNIGGTTLGSVLSFTTKLIQSITFGSAPTVLKDGTGTVSATAAPSGLTVAFTSLTPTTCSTSGTNGSTVTGLIVGNNNCTIAANQTGNGTYDTATQKTQTFSILKATPTVTVTVGTYTYNAAAQGPTVAVTSPVSTGTVTWSYVGVSGTTYGPSAALPT
ncbi:MAG: hypothetical protein HXX17_06630, partial [Geobacteraceae bacterium]|nr:hypothetical protein [Geobacteraceae bacterium]